jgi:hypothetical protein
LSCTLRGAGPHSPPSRGRGIIGISSGRRVIIGLHHQGELDNRNFSIVKSKGVKRRLRGKRDYRE